MLNKSWCVVEKTELEIVYTGKYKTEQFQITGRIAVRKSNNHLIVRAFVYNPPEELKAHPKHGCFKHIGGGWFEVNWAGLPKQAIEAFTYLEKLFQEVDDLIAI